MTPADELFKEILDKISKRELFYSLNGLALNTDKISQLKKAMLEAHYDCIRSLDIDIAELDSVTMLAVSELLNSITFNSNSIPRIEISDSKLTHESFARLILFIENLKNPIISWLELNNLADKIDFNQLKSLVLTLSKSKTIITSTFKGSKLWKMDIKKINELVEIAVKERESRSYLSLTLWDREEEYTQLEPTATAQKQAVEDKVLIARKALLNIYTMNYASDSRNLPLVPFALTIREYLDIFTDSMKQYPNTSKTINNLEENCRLHPNENKADLLKPLHLMKMGLSTYAHFDLGKYEYSSKELDALLKTLNEKQFKDYYSSGIDIDLSKLNPENTAAIVRFINNIPLPPTILNFALNISSSSLDLKEVSESLYKLTTLVDAIQNPKCTSLSISDVFLNKASIDVLKKLFCAIAHHKTIHQSMFRGCGLVSLDFKSLTELKQTINGTKSSSYSGASGGALSAASGDTLDKSVSLWQPQEFSHFFAGKTEKGEAEELMQWASKSLISLSMQSQPAWINQTPFIPYSLKINQYLELLTKFMKENPERASFVKPLAEVCLLDPSEKREPLLNSILKQKLLTEVSIGKCLSLDIANLGWTTAELSTLQTTIKNTSLPNLRNINLDLANFKNETLESLTDLINALPTKNYFELYIDCTDIENKETSETIKLLLSVLLKITHPYINLRLGNIGLDKLEFNELLSFMRAIIQHNKFPHVLFSSCRLINLDIKQLSEIKKIKQDFIALNPTQYYFTVFGLWLEDEFKGYLAGKTEKAEAEVLMQFASKSLINWSMANSDVNSPFVPFPLSIKQLIELFSNFIKENPKQLYMIKTLVDNCVLSPGENRELLSKPLLKQTLCAKLSTPQCSMLELDQFEWTAAELIELQTRVPTKHFNEINNAKLDLGNLKPDLVEPLSMILNKLANTNSSGKHFLNLHINDSRTDLKGTSERIKIFLSLLQTLDQAEWINICFNNIVLDKIDFDSLKLLMGSLVEHKTTLNIYFNSCNLEKLDLKSLIELANQIKKTISLKNLNKNIHFWQGHEQIFDNKAKTEDEIRQALTLTAEKVLLGLSLSNHHIYTSIVPQPLPIKIYQELFSNFIKENPEKAGALLYVAQYCLLLANEKREDLLKPISKQMVLSDIQSSKTVSLTLESIDFSDSERAEILRTLSVKSYTNLNSINIDINTLTLENVSWLADWMNRIKINTQYQTGLNVKDSNTNNKEVSEKIKLLLKLAEALKNPKISSLSLSSVSLESLSFVELKNLIRTIAKHKVFMRLELTPDLKLKFDTQRIEEIGAIVKFSKPNFHVSLNAIFSAEDKQKIEAFNEEDRLTIARNALALLGISGVSRSEPFLPFPLSIEQYKMLFTEFLNNNDNVAWHLSSLIQNCLLIPGEKEKRPHLVQFMATSSTHNLYDLDINQLDFSSQNLMQLQKTFNEKWPEQLQSMSIDLSKFQDGALQDIVAFINNLNIKWQSLFKLTIKDSNVVQDRAKRLTAFILGIKNPKILSLDLVNNNLGTLGSQLVHQFITEILINNPHKFQSVTLMNNKLDQLNNECISVFNSLLGLKKVKQLLLGNNDLWKLDLKILSEIASNLEKNPGLDVQLWSNSEQFAIDGWEKERRLNFAKLYLRIQKGNPNTIDKPIPFKLEEKECFELLQSYIQSKPKGYAVVDFWVKYYLTTYSLRLEIAQLRFKASTPTWGSPIKDYNLAPKDRLDIALSSIEQDPHLSFTSFNLVESDDLIEAKLFAQKLLQFDKEIAEEANEIIDNLELIEKFKCDRLSELRAICDILWTDDFYSPCLNRLQAFGVNDSYSFIKFYNMLDYLLWTLVLLTTKNPPSQPKEFGEQLRAIMDFADPKKRYKLSSILINTIYSDQASAMALRIYNPHHFEILSVYFPLDVADSCMSYLFKDPKLYSKILKGQTTSALLPSIPLYKIILSLDPKTNQDTKSLDIKSQGERQGLSNPHRSRGGEQANKKSNLIVREESPDDQSEVFQNAYVKDTCEILSSLPSAYKEGYYQRYFVSAVVELANYQRLTSAQKLDIIKIILLQKSSQRNQIETLLKIFESGCDAKSKMANDQREKMLLPAYQQLIKLAGEPTPLKQINIEGYLSHLFDPKKQIEWQQQTLGALKLRMEKEFLSLKTEKNSAEVLELLKSMKENYHLQKPMEIPERKKVFLEAYASLIKICGTPVALKRFSLEKYLADVFDPMAHYERQKKGLNNLKRRVSEAFNLLLSESELREQVSYWLLIQGLGLLLELQNLVGISYNQIKSQSQALFSKLFAVDNDTMKFFGEGFSGLRNESALYTYLGKINTLSDDALKKTYSNFINNVLSPKQNLFFKERYDL